jgi:hypothetical protein
MPINTWAAVDDYVLGAFRDGRARTVRDVYRMLPDLTHREILHALDVNTDHGRLSEGESTFIITPVGLQHLNRAPAGVV